MPAQDMFSSDQDNLKTIANVADPESLQGAPDQNATTDVFLKGWRHHFLFVSVGLCLFLVNIEVSVVGTSLVTITKHLHAVGKSGWVITGYLITYTGLLIFWAKLSDTFGRKGTAIIAVLIFTAFSAGCGAARTMNQLIICRVFQGIGAAGCYSLGVTIAYEMVSKDKYPLQAAKMAGAIALGSLTGPFIGGGSSQTGQWRWAFLFNVPAGVVTILLLVWILPTSFPLQEKPQSKPYPEHGKFSEQSLSRLDVTGAFFLLGATMLLVAVLLEGGISIAWHSATAIVLFVVSGLMWISFIVIERYFTQNEHRTEPIFPWRFVQNRTWMGTLLISMLSGIPYNIITIDLPQRFQTMTGATPLDAAVRILPFNLVIALSGMLVNLIAGKTGFLPIWLTLFGSTSQLAGLIWFCMLPLDGTTPSTIYACQALTALGIGCVMGILVQIPPRVADKRDLAISGSALMQFRVFGGVLGLSITTTAFNNYLTSHLASQFGNMSASDILRSAQAAQDLSPDAQQQILVALAGAYNLQMKILAGFAGLQVLLTSMMYRSGNQIRVIEDLTKETSATPQRSHIYATEK